MWRGGVSERWVDPARVAVARTLDPDEIKARDHEKIDERDGVGARPVRHRARPELGEQVSPATIYGRARRARLKAMVGG